MRIPIAERLTKLGSYAFAAVDEAVSDLKSRNIDVIDFGVGDHTIPAPEVARERIKTAVEEHATSGYPSYVGAMSYREAIAAWTKRRFGVDVDPVTEITSTIGSKEGVFNFPEAFINPGDVVIIPTPGYPPYTRGTQFAEGEPYHVPLLEENGYLIDFERIPADVREKAKMLWICYPNSPSGRIAPLSFFEEAVAFCREHNILLCSDEAYTEIYFTEEKPHTVLEVAGEGFENVVVFQSMSKRSMMTGWRIGWVTGDNEAITAFKKLKTNIDSGTPSFIQEAAIATLEDEAHVEAMRRETAEKRDILADAFVLIGLKDCRPEATLYHWQRVPDGMSEVDFVKKLLADEIAIVGTPGSWLSNECPDPKDPSQKINPGEGHVRFSLVPSVERVKDAAARIKKLEL